MIDERLIEALAIEDLVGRRFAAQRIGEIGGSEAVGVLLGRLKRESARSVKEAILASLAQIWASGPVDEIVQLLRDPDPFVRAEATEMLRRRDGDAIEPLSQLVHGEDKDLRKSAIDILSQAPEGAPDELCLAALRDDDLNVVISMIESIGTGRRSAFLAPVLAIALNDPHPMTMCACLETLGLIGNRATLDTLRGQFPDAATVPGLFLLPFLKLLGGTAGPEAVDEVCRLIASRDEDEAIQIEAAAVDTLTGIVARNPDARLSETSEAALLGLLRSGHDPGQDTERGFHIVRLLGHFASSRRVVLALLPLLRGPNRTLCLIAAEALANSPAPQVTAALSALLVAETDPDTIEDLEEVLGRRAQWNSLPSNLVS